MRLVYIKPIAISNAHLCINFHLFLFPLVELIVLVGFQTKPKTTDGVQFSSHQYDCEAFREQMTIIVV
jgi:hypothetical protein